jgi:hypothetical protein
MHVDAQVVETGRANGLELVVAERRTVDAEWELA